MNIFEIIGTNKPSFMNYINFKKLFLFFSEKTSNFST